MGAPIIIGNSYDLWVSNSMKDTFCEVLTAVATLEGHDVEAIYEEAPGVAGTYGVPGVGIVLDKFYLVGLCAREFMLSGLTPFGHPLLRIRVPTC